MGSKKMQVFTVTSASGQTKVRVAVMGRYWGTYNDPLSEHKNLENLPVQEEALVTAFLL